MSEKNTTAIPVKYIVASYLRLHGFAGLTDGEECGCFLADLAPCEGFGPECVPGYAGLTNDGEHIIQSEKPAEGF